MLVDASPVNLFLFPSLLGLEGIFSITPFCSKWTQNNPSQSYKGLSTSPGGISNLYQWINKLNGDELWLSTQHIRTGAKFRFSGFLSRSQNSKEFSDNKQTKISPQTLILFITNPLPHCVFLHIPALILSFSLCLSVCLFWILHLWLLCLKSFYIPF